MMKVAILIALLGASGAWAWKDLAPSSFEAWGGWVMFVTSITAICVAAWLAIKHMQRQP